MKQRIEKGIDFPSLFFCHNLAGNLDGDAEKCDNRNKKETVLDEAVCRRHSSDAALDAKKIQ